MTDLVSMLGVAQATGGNQLSGYGSIGYANNYNLITRNWIMSRTSSAVTGFFGPPCSFPSRMPSWQIKLELPAGSPERPWTPCSTGSRNTAYGSAPREFLVVGPRVRGGALVVNTDQDPEMPLNYRRLKGAPIEFYDMDRWQISARNFDAIDPLCATTSRMPIQLYVNGVKMHASRAILGKGKQAPVYIRRQLFGWGMSEAERMLRDQ